MASTDAILECVVHLRPPVKSPDPLLLTLDIPNAGIVHIAEADLPDKWIPGCFVFEQVKIRVFNFNRSNKHEEYQIYGSTK